MAKTSQENSIWSGVYTSFDDAPEVEPVFNSDIWVEKQQVRVREILSTLSDGHVIPDNAIAKDYPLPTMVSLLLEMCKSLRVIDFGGAMGQSYLDLLAKIPKARSDLDYTVVETEALVKNVPDEMKAFENLTFTDDVDTLTGTADVVHIGSTLQYIDDWPLFLDQLSEKFQPKLFILSDLLVGDVPSFVTIQRYYDQTIRARFINISEFEDYWRSKDFNLIYKSYFQPLEGDVYFPNQGLPETHRINTACHMVFSCKQK
tara:strand:- start:14590 stop:15366 length:777 start_codon:yes stop_codon:yes gene_type:complete